MHSEILADHDLALGLFDQLATSGSHFAQFAQFEVRHRDIIKRFGRYPHRNTLLKREATPEEIEFLRSGRRPTFCM